MNKRVLTFCPFLKAMTILCCLWFSIGTFQVLAQGMPEFKYELSSPHVKSFELKDKGFSVSFDNVKWSFDQGLAFYEILTREYDITKDGEFAVSNTQIYTRKETSPLGAQVYLDDYMSESG